MQRDKVEGSPIKMTKLKIIDLAGSEKFIKSYQEDKDDENKRIRELISINKSLTALGHCIKSMGDKSVHIPYRNSKITRILKDSISGRSKIFVIINLSPCKRNYHESISSLQFADRLKKVKLEIQNKVINKNNKNYKNLVRELECEKKKRQELEMTLKTLSDSRSDCELQK